MFVPRFHKRRRVAVSHSGAGNKPIIPAAAVRSWYDAPMQLRLPWSAPATRSPPAAPSVVVDGRTFAIRIARHRRARRYVLRLTTDGALRLTVPRGSSIAGGVRFTERQSDWIAREWRRQQESAAPWTTGTTLWMRGERIALEVH